MVHIADGHGRSTRPKSTRAAPSRPSTAASAPHGARRSSPAP